MSYRFFSYLARVWCELNVSLPGKSSGELAGCAPGLAAVQDFAVTPELLCQLRAAPVERESSDHSWQPE